MDLTVGVATGNAVLDALPPDDHEALLRGGSEVHLDRGEILFDVGSRMSEIHFPIDAVISVVVVMSDGSSVEAAMLGRHGMGGVPLALGRDRWSVARGVTQIPGRAVVIEADLFRSEVERRPRLREVMRSTIFALMTELAQTVACNRLHHANERLARWLARAHDSAASDHLPVTQEFIAEMLGVRRATVTVAAQRLHDDDAIRYSRGRIVVTDGDRLRERACECYGVITRQYAELLSPR